MNAKLIVRGPLTVILDGLPELYLVERGKQLELEGNPAELLTHLNEVLECRLSSGLIEVPDKLRHIADTIEDIVGWWGETPNEDVPDA